MRESSDIELVLCFLTPALRDGVESEGFIGAGTVKGLRGSKGFLRFRLFSSETSLLRVSNVRFKPGNRVSIACAII